MPTGSVSNRKFSPTAVEIRLNDLLGCRLGEDQNSRVERNAPDLRSRGAQALAHSLDRAASRPEAILDAIPQMVWSTNTRTGEEYYNRQWREFTGVALGGRDSIARVSLVHPEDRDGAAAAWKRSLATGEAYQAEYRLRHCSGEYRWILSRGQPERDEQGNVTSWFGSCTDIHERVLAQKALDLREQSFRDILDSMPQIVWSMGGDGRRPDYYNKGWYEFTGLKEGSLSGPDWLDLYHPEDRKAAWAAWRRARVSGQPYECEFRLKDRSGDYRWIVARGRAERDADGNILRWYGTCTDAHERVLARHALDRSEKWSRTILDSIPQVIWSATPDGKLDYISRQWALFRGSRTISLGDGWMEAVHVDDRDGARAIWQRSVRTGKPYEAEFRVEHHSGEFRWALVRAFAHRDEAGTIVHWYGTCTDIHDRVIAQQALDTSERLNQGIIEASPDCTALLDLSGRIMFVNAATLRASGLGDAAHLVGECWTTSFHPRLRHRAERALAKAQSGKIGRFVHAGGQNSACWWDVVVAPVCDEAGKPMKLVALSRDITHQKRAEEKVRWAANHDALTGLPNRALLQNRVDAAIRDADGAGGGFALLMLDVDHFKRINDTVGHDAGDALLCTFAERLKAATRPDDLVARLGGDEFAVLLSATRDSSQIEGAVDRILGELGAPCVHAGRMLDCRASIGASIYPDQATSRTELLKNADVALYAAKAAGRSNFQLFHSDMRMEMQRRSSMLSLAKDALEQQRIVPFYQPKVDLATGQVAGFEALLRWRHPSRGIQTPDTISAAFEDLKLAAEISDRMIDCVIRDICRWLNRGIDFGHVAINAAAAEFRRGDFAERLLERLAANRIDPRHLQVEVTETVFLGRGADYVERALKTLSAGGIRIALDDFGTGYASLSHLKQFPVDILKIDRSFVRNLRDDPDDAAIISAVIQLGRSLGIEIVAEGIETAAQEYLLHGRGCDYGQGFLYSKAVPARRVPALVLDAKQA